MAFQDVRRLLFTQGSSHHVPAHAWAYLLEHSLETDFAPDLESRLIARQQPQQRRHLSVSVAEWVNTEKIEIEHRQRDQQRSPTRCETHRAISDELRHRLQTLDRDFAHAECADVVLNPRRRITVATDFFFVAITERRTWRCQGVLDAARLDRHSLDPVG